MLAMFIASGVHVKAFYQAAIMSQGVELPSGSSLELGEMENDDLVSLHS
jgi:hypothetical protein